MGKIKLVAYDMDHTLLNSKKEITPEVLATMAKAREQGVVFAMASGRSYKSAKQYFEILAPLKYAILFNGGLVMDLENNVKLCDFSLDKSDAKQLMYYAKEHDIAALVWCGEELYVNKKDPYCENYAKFSNAELVIVEDVEKFCQKQITKILWLNAKEEIAKYYEVAKTFKFNQTDFYKSEPHILEFNNSQANKGTGVKLLADHLGISKDEVMTLGDEENDLSMIEYAGYGVAMANASEAVLKVANYVTDHCDNFGVVKAIEKFVLDD